MTVAPMQTGGCLYVMGETDQVMSPLIVSLSERSIAFLDPPPPNTNNIP